MEFEKKTFSALNEASFPPPKEAAQFAHTAICVSDDAMSGI